MFCRVEGLTRALAVAGRGCHRSSGIVADANGCRRSTQELTIPAALLRRALALDASLGRQPGIAAQLPVILGILVLPVTFLIWKPLVGRRAALWALILLSAGAFPIWHSQDAKMYAAVWLLATIAGGAFLHALTEGPERRSWLTIYALSNASLLLVSYVGVIPVLVQGLFGVFLALRRRMRARLLVETATAAICSSLPLLIWLLLSHRAITNRKGIEWIAPTSGDRFIGELFQHCTIFLLGLQPAPHRLGAGLLGWLLNDGALGLLAVIGGVVIVYWVQLARDAGTTSPLGPTRAEIGAYLAQWALLPPLGAFLFSLIVFPLSGVPRYMAAAGPGLFMLVATALVHSSRVRWPLALVFLSWPST